MPGRAGVGCVQTLSRVIQGPSSPTGAGVCRARGGSGSETSPCESKGLTAFTNTYCMGNATKFWVTAVKTKNTCPKGIYPIRNVPMTPKATCSADPSLNPNSDSHLPAPCFRTDGSQASHRTMAKNVPIFPPVDLVSAQHSTHASSSSQKSRTSSLVSCSLVSDIPPCSASQLHLQKALAAGHSSPSSSLDLPTKPPHLLTTPLPAPLPRRPLTPSANGT